MFDFLWSKPPEPEPSIGIGTMIFYFYIAFVLIRLLGKFQEGDFNIDVKHGKRGNSRKGRNSGKNYIKDKIYNENKNVGQELDNVIGLEGVKEEIKYYMDFINNRKKYSEWGVKLPKGILLAGPPGTGKTLLVKSMAEALDIPIISVAGSSFVEMYVGVGASRVRKLFKTARDQGDKCIIFIDELDAVGSKRNLDKNSERASTLNQLLVEMDGFDEEDGIIVFAATNMIKHLDNALLRSGRFDKKIYFDPPNFSERKQMFELYLKDIDLPTSLSHAVLSDRSAGMTGADIANITNQAKINAIQRGQDGVVLLENDIQIAIDEVMIGREKRERMMTEAERKRVSHHEAGHALMGYILKDSEPPVKVSIIPRGESALGFSQPKPANKKLYSQRAILAQICVLLGGRAAEKVIYGDVSTGAADDIEKISHFVKLYNTDWGMSKELGPINPGFLGVIGENISNSVFSQCKVMVDKLEEFTISILEKHKDLVVSMADDLIKNETIVYNRIKQLFPDELENSLVCEDWDKILVDV
jgi:cell division protease FtsH